MKVCDSGAVPMPAFRQFGNGDYNRPLDRLKFLLAQILGMYCTEALSAKVKVGFELRTAFILTSLQELNRDIRSVTSCRNCSMFLFLHFNNSFGEYCCLSPAPLYKRNGMIQVILNSSIYDEHLCLL